MIQRVLKEEAAKKIDRLFTYATPHRGIHFRRGLGFLTGVRDLLDRYSNFQIRLRLLPLFVRNRRVLRDRHYPSEHLFQHTLTVGIRDSDGGDGRLVRARWAGLDRDLPARGKRYLRNDNIRFPLPSKNLEQGDLVLRVLDERSNSN